jgi:hypothetical protein
VYDFGVTMTFFFSGRAVVSKLIPACSHSLQRLRAVVKGSRLTEISSHLQNELSDVDCTTNREIIRGHDPVTVLTAPQKITFIGIQSLYAASGGITLNRPRQRGG